MENNNQSDDGQASGSSVGQKQLVLRLIEDLIGIAGEHNPQHPEMEKMFECPEYDEHQCCHCEIIHRARRFLKQNKLLTERKQKL